MKLKLLVAFVSTLGVASIATAADLSTPPVAANDMVVAPTPDVQKPDLDEAHTAKPDVDVETPDVDKPEVEKPDMDKPEIEKPDMDKPDVEKPNVEKD